MCLKLKLDLERSGVALCQYHLGAVAGAAVSADQGCPSRQHTGAALVGWPRLVWASSQGLTEEVGQLGYPDPAPSPLSR